MQIVVPDEARPLTLTGGSVLATLKGDKTQSRRIVRFRHWQELRVVEVTEHGPFRDQPKNTQIWSAVHQGKGRDLVEQGLKCPYGLVGEYLYVRETWTVPVGDAEFEKYKPSDLPKHAPIFYKAGYLHNRKRRVILAPWRSARFMPKWAARILLQLVRVRLQRVQAITQLDAEAEGVRYMDGKLKVDAEERAQRVHRKRGGSIRPRDYFAALWDSLNGHRGDCTWDRNPWVWALTFRKVKP